MGEFATDSRACPLCSACFSRVDAAKRHAKRCPKREGRNLVDRKRGRRLRSCPLSTPGGGPCERCIPRKLTCSFNRYNADITSHLPLSVSPGANGLNDGRVPLSFLLNSTDDQQDYFTERTVGMEPDGVPLGPACLPLTTSISNDELLDYFYPSILLLFDNGQDDTPTRPDGLNIGRAERHLSDLAFSMSSEFMIAARISSLEVELIRHAERSLDCLVSLDSHSYRSFFCVCNVRRFVTTFCQKRHYRYPIIHWPTFELETAPLALFMVVCLTGAAYSFGGGQNLVHAVQARTFYQLADSYVFQQLESHLHGSLTEPNYANSIELCQAALLMYALDTLPSGDMAMQHTAVTRRLSTVIQAVRELGFVTIQHEPSEGWQVFVYREQIIRLVAWTFCADCLATLSCNKPPGFSILEMRGDLPCDPKIWDTDAVSFPGLRESFRQSTPPCLADLMSHWLNDGWQTPIDCMRLPVFHLHIMLCAFQQTIFNLHITMNFTQQSSTLLRALNTWRGLWCQAIEQLAHEDRKWLGVAKNVSDLEYLTQRIIEVAAGSEAASSRYLQRVPSLGTREIHEFMQMFVSK
ncbi:hypothetical protein K431DRAFT_341588 [Polychaeton citri CBS 116435]|uniref:Xylanolytic transcriptional activator regulatory domain-containing protein n=1 Tax=Polychaeton citri CBS 116435 TaxID=1314669 RepID=A0A9P4Q0F6_9PEZI|nr:hypothetical protein K431DRAFT_341588 [Polychaeton citri CBS 116435]